MGQSFKGYHCEWDIAIFALRDEGYTYSPSKAKIVKFLWLIFTFFKDWILWVEWLSMKN